MVEIHKASRLDQAAAWVERLVTHAIYDLWDMARDDPDQVGTYVRAVTADLHVGYLHDGSDDPMMRVAAQLARRNRRLLVQVCSDDPLLQWAVGMGWYLVIDANDDAIRTIAEAAFEAQRQAIAEIREEIRDLQAAERDNPATEQPEPEAA